MMMRLSLRDCRLARCMCGVAVLAVAACSRRVRQEPTAAPDDRGSVAVAIADLGTGPITQFENACARCHGPHGALFDESYRKLDRLKLAKIVADMMTGP